MYDSRAKKNFKPQRHERNFQKAIKYKEDVPSISNKTPNTPMPLYSPSESPRLENPNSSFSNFELTILILMISSFFMITDILINWQSNESTSKTVQDILNVLGIGISIITSVFCIIMIVIRYSFKYKILNTKKRLKLFI